MATVRLMRLSLAICLLSACGPTAPGKPQNANVTWAPGTTKLEASFWSNQPSVVMLEGVDDQGNGVRNRVVAGFNDAAGFYERRGLFLAPKTDGTLAGIAISDDFGVTWSRPTPRLAVEGSRLFGGVWLSSNQTSVVYSSVGGAGDPLGDGRATKIFVARTGNGEAWTTPTVATELSAEGEAIRQQSISISAPHPEAIVVAYTKQRLGEPQGAFLVTSDDHGATWSPPAPLSGLPRDAQHVIIKLANYRSGWIAFSTFADGGTRELGVAKIDRSGFEGDTNWRAIQMFSISYQVPARVVIRPSAAESDPGAWWHDAFPYSFDVGNVNLGGIDHDNARGRLHLVFASNNADGIPQIQYAYCDDDNEAICRSSTNWHLETVGVQPPDRIDIPGLPVSGQHQPVVAANRLNFDVAVSWYQDAGTLNRAGTRAMTVRGRRATSYSATFGAIVAVDNRRWAACPAAEYAHFYGWNLGSLVVPQLHQQGEQPLVLTLYANSSGGCDPSSAEPPTPTFDQHVESSKW